jgi:prolipoprotein diacylglyceryl transferase
VPDHWWGPFAVWQGGLGVWGGILFGCIAGAVVIHRSGESVRLFADAVAPGLLIAQGIGRWGNWFNQELYGKPTNLPWGLEIDERHRQPQYVLSDTFHPTFLYEFLYDLTMAGVLILIGWRFRIKPPGLFALYVAFYTFGRTFEELLRVDPSHHFLGERLNFWVSAVVCVCAVAFFVWWQFFHESGEPTVKRKPREAPKGPAMAVPKGRVRPRR